MSEEELVTKILLNREAVITAVKNYLSGLMNKEELIAALEEFRRNQTICLRELKERAAKLTAEMKYYERMKLLSRVALDPALSAAAQAVKALMDDDDATLGTWVTNIIQERFAEAGEPPLVTAAEKDSTEKSEIEDRSQGVSSLSGPDALMARLENLMSRPDLTPYEKYTIYLVRLLMVAISGEVDAEIARSLSLEYLEAARRGPIGNGHVTVVHELKEAIMELVQEAERAGSGASVEVAAALRALLVGETKTVSRGELKGVEGWQYG